MNTNFKAFPFPSGKDNIVSSTPKPGKSLTEALNYSWPSPITQGRPSELQHPEEKAQQCREPQEPRSQIPVAGLLTVKVQKFTKLSVIPDTEEEDEDEEMTILLENPKSLTSPLLNKNQSEKRLSLHVRNNQSKQREELDKRNKAVIVNTDEEDEDRTVPLGNVTNFKSSSLNKNQSKKRPSLHVQNNKSKQKKEVDDKRNKAVIVNSDEEENEDEKMTVSHKNVKNLRTILLNKSQSKRRPSLNVRNNKSKQRKEVDKRSKDARNSLKKSRNSLAPQLEIREESKDNIIEDQRQETQNSYSPRNTNNKYRKKQSDETLKLDHKIDPKLKKNTVTVQTGVPGNIQNETVLKQTRKSLAPQLKIIEESEHSAIEDQRQEKQNEYSQRNKKNAYRKKQSNKTVILDNKIDSKQKKNIATLQTGVTENRQNEENDETVLIPEEKQEKENLSKTHSRRLNLSQQHTDTANIQDIVPESELPAVTENTDDDRSTQKLKKSPQESESRQPSNSGKESHTSSASRKRSLFSHEKASFISIEGNISRDSTKKLAYHYAFLEEKRDRVPKRKRKFNSKETVTGDLRRSKRTRVKPLAHWIGERLNYKIGSDWCFEIVGVEPAITAEPNQRRRNIAESEQICFSIPLQKKEIPEPKMVQIVNEGGKQDIECFSTLRPESVSEEFSKYKMLDSAVAEAGFVKLAPSTNKNFQPSPTHYVFFILKGHALVQIQDTTQEVKPGQLFQVPKGVSYSIQNLSKKQLVLQFVMVK